MSERLKEAVLKTVERKFRGFESLSLRSVNSIDMNILWISDFIRSELGFEASERRPNREE